MLALSQIPRFLTAPIQRPAVALAPLAHSAVVLQRFSHSSSEDPASLKGRVSEWIDPNDLSDKSLLLKTALNAGNLTAAVAAYRHIIFSEQERNLWKFVSPHHNTAECFRFLRGFSVHTINQEDEKGETALHHAIEHCYAEKVDLLLHHGASKSKLINLDSETRIFYQFSHKEPITPLKFARAVYNRNLENSNYAECKKIKQIIESLSATKFDDKSEVLESKSLLALLAGVASLSLFSSSEEDKEELEKALMNGDQSKLESLKDKVDLRACKGLWILAAKSQKDVGCEFLAKHIPDLIHEEDSNGNTALFHAVKNNRRSNVRILVELGGYVPLKKVFLSKKICEDYDIKPDAQLDMYGFVRAISKTYSQAYQKFKGKSNLEEAFYMRELMNIHLIEGHLLRSVNML